MVRETITCPRCDGTDFVGRYAHHDRGHCYLCKGRGTVEIGVTICKPTKANPGGHDSAFAGQGQCGRCGEISEYAAANPRLFPGLRPRQAAL